MRAGGGAFVDPELGREARQDDMRTGGGAEMSEQRPSRPLPRLNEPDTSAFWQATRRKELRYQRCDDCRALVFPPRRHCARCTSGRLSWLTASGKGRIHTYTIVRQSHHPFFRGRTPYVIACIELEEGPRLVANLLADEPLAVRIGQEVRLAWEEHEELCIPLFRLV